MQHQFFAPRDKVFTGIFLFIIGLLLLISKITPGVVPVWLVTWPMAIIGTGILLGVITRRKTIVWLIPIFWGVYALLEQQMPELNLKQYSGAISIIFVGLLFIGMRFIPAWHVKKDAFKGNVLNVTTVFSHNQNSFTVNAYNNSLLVCVMGNMEVKMDGNFIQDDAVINASVSMGVVKLTVPPNWVIKNNMTTLLGAVTDNRKPAAVTGLTKSITLAGNVTMGVIEII
jgi:hypothetical protein